MKRNLPARFLSIVLLLFLSLGRPIPAAAAEDIFYGDTIPAGTVVDHDVVLIGQEVSIAGKVVGNVFILGDQVLVTGEVDGSLILIGQNAGIGGEISGAVYALALTLDLAPGGLLERDLYAATVSLTSRQDSRIGRHLYALGLDSGLNGEIGGRLHTAIGPIQLYNGLMTLLGFDELTLQLRFDVPQPDASNPGQIPARYMRLKLLEPLPTFDWGKWALGLLRNWATLFLFGLLLVWLGRKPLDRSGAALLASPWRTLAAGLVVLVVSFNLFLVALLLFAVVFALGLGLNALGLWQVSIALWVAAYSVLALALLGLWFFIAYGTKVIAIQALAGWPFHKLFPRRSVWLDLLALLAGTVIYSLLRTVPYVGWAFALLVTAAGMGAAWNAYRERRKKVEPVEIPAAAEPKKKSARK